MTPIVAFGPWVSEYRANMFTLSAETALEKRDQAGRRRCEQMVSVQGRVPNKFAIAFFVTHCVCSVVGYWLN